MTPTLNSDTWMVFDIMYYQREAKNDCPSTETSILLAPVLPFRVSEFLHGRIETTRIVRRLTRSNARNKTAGGGTHCQQGTGSSMWQRPMRVILARSNSFSQPLG
jgi:hypothetical protein